jgi:hypothetical protein
VRAALTHRSFPVHNDHRLDTFSLCRDLRKIAIEQIRCLIYDDRNFFVSHNPQHVHRGYATGPLHVASDETRRTKTAGDLGVDADHCQRFIAELRNPDSQFFIVAK